MSRTPAESESDTNLSPQRRAWADKNLDPEARTLLAEDEKYFLRQSVSTPCLNAIVKAEGIWIEDTAGRRYMDFHGNNVHHIGYGHPRLKRAIAEQMDALPFAPRRYTCGPAVALAAKLAEIAPGNLSKVLFTTGGSDAIEVAIKIARAATGRYKTLSFWDAFHGAGFGASAVGGEALFRSGGVGPLMPGAEHVAPYAAYRCPYGTSTIGASADACARMIEYVLEREGDVAAFIAEPMRAVPHIPPPGFWRRVRDACDRHGTLLIFDEIPTGLGKTGKMFACAARRRGAGHPGARQGARRRHPADRRRDRAARARRRRRARLRPLHAREKPGHDARGAHHHRDHRGRGSGRECRQGRRASRSRGSTT